MTSDLFRDSSLLKPFAIFTQKQVGKSLNKFSMVERLKESANRVTKFSRENVEMKYYTHLTVCDCVRYNPKELGGRDIPTPPSLPGCSSTNSSDNHREVSPKELRTSKESL